MTLAQAHLSLAPRAQLRFPLCLVLPKPPTLPARVDMDPPLGWVAREAPARAGGVRAQLG
eukprot:SAG25_NODE_11515_length_302_cov_1.004926_1_plen_59_part_10